MSSKPLNILLADDDTDDCAFFKAALAEIPLSTHLIDVHDGEQLMHLLINETTVLPDVIFLDLNMPRKNGFECLSEIKLSNSLKRLSVIVFSTSFEQEVVNLLYQKGALYFIRKPSEFVQFKNIIQKSLEMVLQGNISQPDREHFVLAIPKDLPSQAF